MKKRKILLLLSLVGLTLVGCSNEAERKNETSILGDYTYTYEGKFGEETLQFSLKDNSVVQMSLPGNTMLADIYEGTYSNVDYDVTILGLKNIDSSSPYAYPGLWDQIDKETGNCEIKIDITAHTFTFLSDYSSNTDPDTDPDSKKDETENTPTKEMGTNVGDSVSGEYRTELFDTTMGTKEKFVLKLMDDYTVTLSLEGEDGTPNQFMGPYSGSYWHEHNKVHLIELTNPNAQLSKAPDLWSDMIYASGDYGYATAILGENNFFEFVKISSDGSNDEKGDESKEEGYTEWKDAIYDTTNNLSFVAKMKNGPGARSAFITIPGGAFKFVDASAHADLRTNLADKNYVAITLTYRVGDKGKYPLSVQDVKNAIQYIYDNADLYHINKNDINVLGCSAGGYLASMAALTGASDFVSNKNESYSYTINSLVDFFGATQWMNDAYAYGDNSPEYSYMSKKFSELNDDEKKECNPLSYASNCSIKKVWISHGSADNTVDKGQSKLFYEGLKETLGENNTHFEELYGATHEDKKFYASDNIDKVLSFIQA